jgi:trimeric autotransporter adhesin
VLSLVAAGAALGATYTVTNTKNSGGGSLRTAINNANGNPGSTIAFSIPLSDSGYTAATGVFHIRPTPALPAITAAGTIVDGTTQTAAGGNTNTAILGAGGTVGIDGLPLSTVAGPEIQLEHHGGSTTGLDVQAPGVIIRGLAIYGFGTASNDDGSANIRIGAAGVGVLIEKNVIGTPADAFVDPGIGDRSNGDNVRAVGATGGTLRNNLIGYSIGKGVCLGGGSDGWLVQDNEIRGNGAGTPKPDAIDIEYSANATIVGNMLADSAGSGVENYGGGGSNTIRNNTIAGNGTSTAGTDGIFGVRVYGTGSLIDRNIITANRAAGIAITRNSSGNTITRNAIHANGTIGIDLLSASDDENQGTAPYVTRNDPGDGDAGGDGLLNFPVLAEAHLTGSQLVVSGYARPGSTIEFFLSDGDPSGFGEGRTFLLTATEGSGADTDATSGSYPDPFNGLSQGTDTTNRFQFAVTPPPGVAGGSRLTATATVAGNTSEFSGCVVVSSGPAMTLVKSVSPGGSRPPGTDLAYTVNFTNTGGSIAVNPVVTDARPADTDFRLGSVTTNLGTTGLTVAVAYSSDGGATWTYVPSSGAGGAPAGYDRVVTNVRWNFTGNLAGSAPSNAGSVAFAVRIR